MSEFDHAGSGPAAKKVGPTSPKAVSPGNKKADELAKVLKERISKKGAQPQKKESPKRSIQPAKNLQNRLLQKRQTIVSPQGLPQASPIDR